MEICNVYISITKSCFFFLSFLSFFCTTVFCQNQKIADSLEKIYELGNFSKIEKLEILKELTENHLETPKKLYYANQLIVIARSIDSLDYLYTGLLQKGNAYRLKGDLTQALQNFFQAAKIADDGDKHREIGITNIAIADVYSIMGDHDRSITYYQEAIRVLRELNDSVPLGSALLNAGDEYFNHGALDSALVYFKESGEIFEAQDYEIGLAYNLGNIGLVNAQQGNHQQAEENIFKAVELLEKAGDFYPICVYLTYMSDIYLEKGQENMAMSFALQSLDLAKTYDLKEQISDANLQVSKLQEKAGNISSAFRYYKDYIAYRDSVRNVVDIQEMSSLRADYEVFKKQTEIDLLSEQRKNQRLVIFSVSSASILIGLLAFGLYRRNRFIKRISLIIERERDRSDKLLLNILPEETAKELKTNGKVMAKKFKSVSVLFTDFKDFTRYAEKLPPKKLIKTLDYYFSHFDKLMDKYGIEKIKTLGDSYMAVAGLPFPTLDHAHKIMLAAFEMSEFVAETKKNNQIPHATFEIRIGIHSGPVVAGVVGTKKFAYDIWGDTVNIASRMESNCEAGKINVSENTFELIKDHVEYEYRGEIQAKNRGALKMYYIQRLEKTSLAN